MGNFLKVRDPNFKKDSEKTWRAQIPFFIMLYNTQTVASYTVISYSTNSLEPEFAIASYLGVEDQMASAHFAFTYQ